MSQEKVEYEIGSGNVFKDLGFPNPEEELMKARLASFIYHIITDTSITKDKATEILDISEKELNSLLKGRLADYSLDKLLSFLGKLGHDVEIVLHKRPENTPSTGLRITTTTE